MIKNLGKFKQWTGEKFGGAKVTLQTEDFQRLEQETEHRREGYDKVVDSVDILLSYILKKKASPEDGRTKMMPLELFGSCLYHYGTVFPEDSALGVALLNLGQTETRISALQEVLANEIKLNYMTVLENGIQEYKDYDTLRKKLASRRLDYDSKLNRLNKAKKEKPELEQEMQAARIKYEDTEHDLIQKMAYLQEFENEHRDALLQLIDAQLTYHTQSRELLLGLKSNWGEPEYIDTKSNDILGRVMPRDEQPSGQYAHDNKANTSTTSLAKSHTMSRDPSSDSLHNPTEQTSFNQQASHPSSGSNSVAANEYEHYRRALYEFTGQNDDEISFKIGDVITVINEIDKGWWVGEVHGKRGIFPVNYTEPYDPQKHPLPPLPSNETTQEEEYRQTSSHGTPQAYSETHQLTTDHPTSKQGSPDPLYQLQNDDQQLSLPNLTPSSTRRPPPPPISASSPSVPTVSRTKSVAIRAPPPPPPLSSSTSSPSVRKPACCECSCCDYIENVFKPGYCNNCFHKH